MYYFKQKAKADGEFNPYRKGPDIFWIASDSDYTEEELKDLDLISSVAIVIKREQGVATRYGCHYEVSSGALDLFQGIQNVIKRIDSLSVITPSKVRNELLNKGFKEVE